MIDKITSYILIKKRRVNSMVIKVKECNDCEKLTIQRDGISMSASEIKELLARPEYSTVPTVRQELSDEDRKKVMRYENINSFGAEVADLFEDLCDELHRIPTQQEYIDIGVELTEEWWIRETLKKNPYIRDLDFDSVIIQAVKNRQGRGYLSLVNEVHTVALLKEMYPDAKVITHDLLDLVLGVDIVMEYKGKRLYFHVYKNSYWGKKAFCNKEHRGGMKNSEGTFVKYHRDFYGDVSLVYDVVDSDTTELVNGIPLFTEDYIKFSVDRALKNDTIGERISCMNSKLTKLNNWLYKNFGTFVNF